MKILLVCLLAVTFAMSLSVLHEEKDAISPRGADAVLPEQETD